MLPGYLRIPRSCSSSGKAASVQARTYSDLDVRSIPPDAGTIVPNPWTVMSANHITILPPHTNKSIRINK
jgi:hypothetical protein